MRYVVSNTEAESRIRDMIPFRNSIGSWSGQEGWGGPDSFGSLPPEYHDRVRAAVYIVYSYRTPIGWISPDGTATVPDVGYSATTGEHQLTTMFAWDCRRFPERGRTVVPAGGGPRRGGIDGPVADPFAVLVSDDAMRRGPSDSLTVDGDPGVW